MTTKQETPVESKQETPVESKGDNKQTRERRPIPERALDVYQSLTKRKINAGASELADFVKVTGAIGTDLTVNRLVSDHVELEILKARMSEAETAEFEKNVKSHRDALIANL